MKKLPKSPYLLFLLVISFLFLPYFGSTQNLGGGLILGLNASQIDGDQAAGFNKAGLQIGGFVNYKISEGFRIQPELVFEQLGSADRTSLLVQMNYASLPILANFNIPITIDDKVQNIEIHIGPVIGVLLKAKDVFKDEVTGLNSTDLRGVAGIAYRTGAVSFTIRYGYSIASFIPSSSSVNLLRAGRRGLYHNYANFGIRLHLAY